MDKSAARRHSSASGVQCTAVSANLHDVSSSSSEWSACARRSRRCDGECACCDPSKICSRPEGTVASRSDRFALRWRQTWNRCRSIAAHVPEVITADEPLHAVEAAIGGRDSGQAVAFCTLHAAIGLYRRYVFVRAAVTEPVLRRSSAVRTRGRFPRPPSECCYSRERSLSAAAEQGRNEPPTDVSASNVAFASPASYYCGGMLRTMSIVPTLLPMTTDSDTPVAVIKEFPS